MSVKEVKSFDKDTFVLTDIVSSGKEGIDSRRVRVNFAYLVIRCNFEQSLSSRLLILNPTWFRCCCEAAQADQACAQRRFVQGSRQSRTQCTKCRSSQLPQSWQGAESWRCVCLFDERQEDTQTESLHPVLAKRQLRKVSQESI